MNPVITKIGIGLMLAILAEDQSCTDNHRSEADKTQQTATDNITDEANRQTGMPGVTHYTERKIVKTLYELRDQNIATFSYVPDMQGRLWHLCDSIGYGLPYGVQFTNPQRPIYPGYHDSSLIDQPEPNGLFMPPSAEGTWVICAGDGGKPTPVYVEPRVIVSPFKLNAAGDYQAK